MGMLGWHCLFDVHNVCTHLLHAWSGRSWCVDRCCAASVKSSQTCMERLVVCTACMV